MSISIAQLRARAEPRDVIICSLDCALYQVLVLLDGVETLLVEDSGKPFRRTSLEAVREALQVLSIASLHLRQRSAYDEMIGQPPREGDNALLVPLALDPPSGVTLH